MKIFMKNGRPAVRVTVVVRGEVFQVDRYLDTPCPDDDRGRREVLDTFVPTRGRRGGYARVRVESRA